MAGTMLDYIREYGDYTFEEKPLTEVDSLIFCLFEIRWNSTLGHGK